MHAFALLLNRPVTFGRYNRLILLVALVFVVATTIAMYQILPHTSLLPLAALGLRLVRYPLIVIGMTMARAPRGRSNWFTDRWARLTKRDKYLGTLGMPLVIGVLIVLTYYLDFAATDDNLARKMPFFADMDKYDVPIWSDIFGNRPFNLGTVGMWCLMQFLEFVGFLLARAWISWKSIEAVVDVENDTTHNWFASEIVLRRITLLFGPLAIGAVIYDYTNILNSFYRGIDWHTLPLQHHLMYAVIAPLTLIFMQEGALFLNDQAREMLKIMDDIILISDAKAGIRLALPAEMRTAADWSKMALLYSAGWVFTPWHPDVTVWPEGVEAEAGTPRMSPGWLRVSKLDESARLTDSIHRAVLDTLVAKVA